MLENNIEQQKIKKEEEKEKTAIQEAYIKNIKFFYMQVKEWLPEDLEINDAYQEKEGKEEPFLIKDSTGEYQVPILHIESISTVSEDERIAIDIFPRGSSTLLGKGLLSIDGWMGEEKICYFCKDEIQNIEDNNGKKRPIYEGIDKDGWYWTESTISNRALVITKERFLDLLTMVSLYEPNV